MGTEKNVYITDIGTITYRRNRKAKNMSIRISAEGEVRVTVPGACSMRSAEGFVESKHDWIVKKLSQLERREKEKRVFGPGDVIDLLGNEIRIMPGTGPDFRVSQENRDFIIRLPGGFDTEDKTDREKLMGKVRSIGHAEAGKRLPVICASLAYCNGLEYKKVSVRPMKSRWGSCSPANNISLNSALIFLERDLVEYVILHELVHTVHKHHGPAFWAALEKYVPDATGKRKALRKQDMII